MNNDDLLPLISLLVSVAIVLAVAWYFKMGVFA